MMWHQVTVVGNAGVDPDMRYLPSGAAVTSFSVAANKSYTAASGEKVKQTVWFRVSVFGKQAETVNQYVRRGMLVLVTGELQPDKQTGGPRVYQGNDGAHRASFELTASTVRFLSRVEAEQYEQADMPLPEDDIPF